MGKHSSTLVVKKRRGRKIPKLGKEVDKHDFVRPVDMIAESEFLPLLTEALEGNITNLIKILNIKEQVRMIRYLQSQGIRIQ